jgi:hypothetical protein
LTSLRVLGVRMAAICALAMLGCGATESSDMVVGVKDQRVLLVPDINAGWIGWCMTTSHEVGCARGRSRLPIVAETWSSSGPPSVTIGYALTTNKVHFVSVAGSRPIATRVEQGLPDGLRAVEVRIPNLNPEKEILPRFVPLGEDGRRIPQSQGRGSEIAPGVLGADVPVVNVDHVFPVGGVCRIDVSHVAGMVVQEAEVVSRVVSRSGIIGQGFLSCASTSYTLNKRQLTSGLLLNASRSGATPLALPDMRPINGHTGVFQAPVAEGEAVARRVVGAWLVVAGGGGIGQRLAVLEHLRGTVELREGLSAKENQRMP